MSRKHIGYNECKHDYFKSLNFKIVVVRDVDCILIFMTTYESLLQGEGAKAQIQQNEEKTCKFTTLRWFIIIAAIVGLLTITIITIMMVQQEMNEP